jgi:hypothetical protein
MADRIPTPRRNPFLRSVPNEPSSARFNSLLAAAKQLTSGDLNRAGSRSVKSGEGWQSDAWDLYGMVGEFQFIVNTLAGRVGAARLFAGKLNPEDQTQTPEVVENGHPADQALEAFGSTPAARGQLLARDSVNLSVTGDGYLVGIPEAMLADDYKPKKSGKDGIRPEGMLDSVGLNEICWYMLSSAEVKPQKNSSMVKMTIEGTEREFNPDDLWLIRNWNPHPRNYNDADSPTRSSLPVLRELVGLTMHVSAQVDSRLAGAGIFLIPKEAEDAVITAMGGRPDGVDEDWSPFTDAVMEAMIAPVNDRSNASALVPLLLTVPGDTIEKFKYFSFANQLDKEARALREEAIRRLALGMNIPPEVLLGVGGMNHWGAWLVREDTITTYVVPQLQLICDALTTQYLWPVLESQDVEDFKSYVIWYDVDHLISRPNRLEDAVALYNAGVISDVALRDAGQFTDEDAQATVTDDPAITIVLDMIKKNPGLLRNPGVELLLDSIGKLLKGEASAPVENVAETPEQQPIEGELLPMEETGPPAVAASAGWGTTPLTVNVNVEPAEATYTIRMPEGFTASAPAPVVNVVNQVEPTPVEIYNEMPEMNVHVDPAPVTVNTPEVNVNVEPTPVTIEGPTVQVAAPEVTVEPKIEVKPADVKVVKGKPRRIRILRDRDGNIEGAEEDQ